MTAQEVILISALFFGSMNADAADKQAEPTHQQLIAAIEMVESGGDIYVIGDKHLKNKAYGCLQIRQPCVDDVNRRCGTNYKAQQLLGNRDLSVNICKAYINIYATEKRIGRAVTDQDMARIWNGGPNGWKKSSTTAYWKKVKEYLD